MIVHPHVMTSWVPSACPIEAATPEIIVKVHNILIDRHGTVSILHEQLSMKKQSARWMLCLLTVDHKRDFKTMFGDVSM